MRRKTTTQKLNEVITNETLQIMDVEIHHKSSDEIGVLNGVRFKEALEYLCEAEVFANMIDWYFEKKQGSPGGEYIFDSGRANGDSEDIIIVYCHVCNNVSGEDIEKTLLVEE